MSRVLVMFAHPDRGSFGGAVLDRVLAGLSRSGHEVRMRDLYAGDDGRIYLA